MQVVSEYRYYEVQAIDRPLGEADMEALRTLSTRARITAASFTNHYKWGDFQGAPNRRSCVGAAVSWVFSLWV